MNRAYFSFGQAHVHRVNGETFDTNVLCEINAPDPRAIAALHFGTAWSFEYPPEALDGLDIGRHFPRGIRVLRGYER